ncbi:MAG: hypothetical protein HYT93_01800 [Parcubacteria group bacterium]|nr:hypothetical protein [Parcubacteria group bacterium]
MGTLCAVMISAVLLTGACSSMSLPGGDFLQREKTKTSDEKWIDFEDAKISFGDIKSHIDSGKTVTVQDLDYRGFGPNTKNANAFIYTKLEDLFMGTTNDRSRIPDDVARCTAKKGDCYGLLKEISNEKHQGKESLLERITSKEETEITGWKFTALFAVEKREKEEVVVAAYLHDEKPQIANVEKGSDARKSLIDKIGILSLFGF